MLKDIQLIVTDLDGTVLEAGALANQEDVQIFKEIQKKGINVTIATGQDWTSGREIALDFAIDQKLDYMICNNGAYISKVSKYEPIYMIDIAQRLVEKIYDYCRVNQFCWLAFYFQSRHVYWNGVPLTCESLLARDWPKKFVWDDISQNQNFQFNQVLQMMIFIPSEKQKAFEKWYQSEKLDQHLLAMRNDNSESMPFYEFINRHANKGKAVLNLIQHLELTPNQVVCFGDNLNDLEMMKKLPNSVAVGNAVKEVKKVARYQTETNLNAGVSQFIKTEILGEKGWKN